MANENKITAEEIRKAINDNYSPTEVVDWNGLQIIVRKDISLAEMVSFVDYVVKCCFAESDGEYQPELKDAAMRSAVIELYTNIELPADASEKYDMLYSSDLWLTVLEHIDEEQLHQMMISISMKVEHRVRTDTARFEKDVNDFYDSLEKLQEQLSGLFADIEPGDIKNVIGAIANGGIDEDKLVKAYLSQAKGASSEGAVK